MNSEKGSNTRAVLPINKTTFIVVCVGIFIIAVTLCFPLIVRYVFGVSALDEAGQSGDQYGSLNTLFSGLAFTAIIYTIYLQQRDLNVQQNALAKQQDEMEQQRLETFFFNLQDQIRKDRDNILIETPIRKENSRNIVEQKTGSEALYYFGEHLFKMLLEDIPDHKLKAIKKDNLTYESKEFQMAQSYMRPWVIDILFLVRGLYFSGKRHSEAMVWLNTVLESMSFYEKIVFYWILERSVKDSFLFEVTFIKEHPEFNTIGSYFSDRTRRRYIGADFDFLEVKSKKS